MDNKYDEIDGIEVRFSLYVYIISSISIDWSIYKFLLV